MEHGQAIVILRDTESLRRRTRTARRSIWFPLVLLGGLVMGSAVVCSDDPIGGGASGVYWAIAGALAYPATYLFYRWRSLRKGVSDGITPYIAVGLGLVALTLNFVVGVHRSAVAVSGSGGTSSLSYARIVSPARYLLSWRVAVAVAILSGVFALLAWRGGRRGPAILAASVGVVGILFATRLVLPEALFLGSSLLPNTLPIVVAGIALVVLAWIERSPTLGVTAIALGIAGILSGLSIIDNRFGATRGCAADLLGIGAFALISGVTAAVVEWRRR